MASTSDAIFCATASGLLLRIRGSRVERRACPVEAVALSWVAPQSELLVLDSSGRMLAIDSGGGVSVRSLTAVHSFVEPAMAVTAAGTLVDFSRERQIAVPVVWRRRVVTPKRAKNLWHTATFLIDTLRAINLGLTISADSGGGSQRLLDLLVNGPVNAPLRVRFRAPSRPYLSCSLNGLMQPPARLLQFQIAN